MPGMKGGVLDLKAAKQLLAVLGEMGEYVDGEELEAIGSQKPVYESMDGGMPPEGQELEMAAAPDDGKDPNDPNAYHETDWREPTLDEFTDPEPNTRPPRRRWE